MLGYYHNNVLQETSYYHRIVPLFSGTFEKLMKRWSGKRLKKKRDKNVLIQSQIALIVTSCCPKIVYMKQK